MCIDLCLHEARRGRGIPRNGVPGGRELPVVLEITEQCELLTTESSLQSLHLRQRLSVNPSSLLQVDWLAQELQGPTCPHLPRAGSRSEGCHTQHFYVGAKEALYPPPQWATSQPPETFSTLRDGLLGTRHPSSRLIFLRGGGRGRGGLV